MINVTQHDPPTPDPHLEQPHRIRRKRLPTLIPKLLQTPWIRRRVPMAPTCRTPTVILRVRRDSPRRRPIDDLHRLPPDGLRVVARAEADADGVREGVGAFVVVVRKQNRVVRDTLSPEIKLVLSRSSSFVVQAVQLRSSRNRGCVLGAYSPQILRVCEDGRHDGSDQA